MATTYTAFLTECNNAMTVLADLKNYISQVAATAVGMTGTYDSSGELVQRMQRLENIVAWMKADVARTAASLTS